VSDCGKGLFLGSAICVICDGDNLHRRVGGVGRKAAGSAGSRALVCGVIRSSRVLLPFLDRLVLIELDIDTHQMAR
jgi:hypothetical protein